MGASPTYGNFTATALQKVIARADKVWADNQIRSEYEANVEVVTAIRKEQTATLKALEDPEKDNIMKITWVIDCNTGVEDEDGDDCTFDGTRAESKSQEVTLDIRKNVKFENRLNLGHLNDVDQQQEMAVQMLARMKELDEMIAQTVVAKLNAFAGINQFTGDIGVVDGITTFIAPSYWNGNLYGYFAQVAIMNKFRNPFMLHGSNLFQQNWQANYNVQNANQKDQLPKLQSIRSYWDLWNIDSVNSPDAVSYMITKGAVAIANKARYPLNRPIDLAQTKRWSVESYSLPGIYYDIICKEVCAGEDIIYKYKMKAWFGVYLNPTSCNEDRTGIIKIACGTGSES